jgi:hypothetical protein
LDLKIKVLDERPTDRNYYINMAMGLLGKGLGLKAFWNTVENGKFPPISEILEELQGEQEKAAEAQAAEKAAIQAQQQGQLTHSMQKTDMQNKAKTEQIALKAAIDGMANERV